MTQSAAPTWIFGALPRPKYRHIGDEPGSYTVAVGSGGMRRKGRKRLPKAKPDEMPQNWRFLHSTWRTSKLRDAYEGSGPYAGLVGVLLRIFGR